MMEFDPRNQNPAPPSAQEVRRNAKEFHHIENPDYENVFDLDPFKNHHAHSSSSSSQTLLDINDLHLNNNSPRKVPVATLIDHEHNRVPIRPHRPPPPPPTKLKKRAGSENCLLDRDDDYFVLKSASLSKVRSSPHNSSFYTKQSNDTSSHPITREPHSHNNGTLAFYGTTDANSIVTTANKIAGQREQEMQLCMAKRIEEYITRQKFKIFVGTWNVNGQLSPRDVKDWVFIEKDPPDIYFLGFQELDLSKEAYFTESSREEDWMTAVTLSLPHRPHQYVMLKKIRLVGILLLVFVKKIHCPHIRDVSCHHVPTGLLGFMGNKGGVGVRLELHSTTICAVNCHLAAHMEETQRRNQDFSDIYNKMHFQVYEQSRVDIHQHDVVFWLGDLNYRIEELSPDFVKLLIERREYKLLKEKDQLLMQKRDGNVFQGYFEGEINFRPTYKYDPSTDDWDTSEKGRMPAWCDRILWWEHALTQRNASREKPRSSVSLLKYDSHMSLKISDHKPVSALFDVDIKVVDEEKHKKIFEEENRRLDRLENEYLPTMSLNKHDIDFGEVRFQQTKQVTLELVNTGQIPCGFEFICRPGEENPCKQWLTISKSKGIMLKDEKRVIEFEIYVNRQTAPYLNSGDGKLDDILILHLNGGKDFFITVTGKYLPSCFGMSIEALCRLRHPVRQADVMEIQKLCKIEPNRASDLMDQETSSSAILQIPKELWALVDHIYQNGKMQEDLFQHPGLHSEFESIRECLDTKIDTSTERIKLPGSNHSAAESLLIFLEALPVPVIPFYLYGPCLEVAHNFSLSKQVLHGLSKHHRNVLKYILSFLRELLKYKDMNGLDVQLLGSIFSGLILRSESRNRKHRFEARLDRDKATKFIINFLRNEYDE